MGTPGESFEKLCERNYGVGGGVGGGERWRHCIHGGAFCHCYCYINNNNK